MIRAVCRCNIFFLSPIWTEYKRHSHTITIDHPKHSKTMEWHSTKAKRIKWRRRRRSKKIAPEMKMTKNMRHWNFCYFSYTSYDQNIAWATNNPTNHHSSQFYSLYLFLIYFKQFIFRSHFPIFFHSRATTVASYLAFSFTIRSYTFMLWQLQSKVFCFLHSTCTCIDLYGGCFSFRNIINRKGWPN